MTDGWRTVREVAALAGVSPQAVREAIRAARAAGRAPSWRGASLEVALAHGRGGRGGERYLVSAASLPADLAAPGPAAGAVAAAARPLSIPSPAAAVAREAPAAPVALLAAASAPAAAGRGAWMTDIAQAIVASGPVGSRARGHAIAEAARTVVWRYGRKAEAGELVGARTLRTWVAKLERKGLAAGARRKRADAGEKRAIVSVAWDRALSAAGVPVERQREIGHALSEGVRARWASGATSASVIQLLMVAECAEALSAAGVAAEGPDRDALCRLPLNFVGAPHRRRVRLAHKRRTDAGGFAAVNSPSIRRSRAGMEPGEWVAGDVMHFNVVYRRSNGSLATPKLVALMDLATNRMRGEVVFCAPNEAVRREHVLAALASALTDPAFGVPRNFYFDRGGEWRVGVAADDAALLADLARRAGVGGDAPLAVRPIDGAAGWASAPPGMRLALPYRPKSKVIESPFSSFQRTVEPMLPGHVGGDRMAKKVESQGRAPVPVPGTEAEVAARLQEAIAFWNAKPQRGHLGGLSPNQAFAEHVGRGWRAVVLAPGDFDLVFGKDDERTVREGHVLQIDNRVFHAPELLNMEVGTRVRVRIPYAGPGARVTVLDDKGGPLFFADASPEYRFGDPAGAREQARRAGEQRAALAAETAGLKKVDLRADMARAVALSPTAAPNAPLATVAMLPQGAPPAPPAPRGPAPDAARLLAALDRAAAPPALGGATGPATAEPSARRAGRAA